MQRANGLCSTKKTKSHAYKNVIPSFLRRLSSALGDCQLFVELCPYSEFLLLQECSRIHMERHVPNRQMEDHHHCRRLRCVPFTDISHLVCHMPRTTNPNSLSPLPPAAPQASARLRLLCRAKAEPPPKPSRCVQCRHPVISTQEMQNVH